MTIVDTSVWIDYFRDSQTLETVWLDTALPDQHLGLTDLILCEILQGIDDESESHSTERVLSRFEMVSTGGPALASVAATNYRFLRRRGKTVRKTIDCLIATFCIENACFLLHRDRDFDAFEEHLGLKVIHPVSH